jgi:Brp/Blh family beta-carotene 15,15'-monooxygenase
MTRADRLQAWAFAAGGAVLVALSTIPGFAARPWQITVLVGLVALAGLPHGALDPLVARRAALWRRPSGLAGFLLAYVGLAAGALGVGWMAPEAAWGVFLLLSAWHFSGDWKSSAGPVVRLGAGLSIVSLPAVLHAAEVEALFAAITGGGPLTSGLVSAMEYLAPVALAALVAGILQAVRKDRAAALELALVGVFGLVLPPLLFFIVYFCGLHSPRHVTRVTRGMPMRAVLLTGALFTALAVAAGAASLVLLGASPLDEALVRVTFGGLAALTVPHIFLVEWGLSRRVE